MRAHHDKFTGMEAAFRLSWTLTLFTVLGYNAAFGAGERPMMKAVVAHEYGAPEVLKFEEVARPEPKDCSQKWGKGVVLAFRSMASASGV